MKLRKVVALLLSLILVMSITGCSTKQGGTDNTPTTGVAQTDQEGSDEKGNDPFGAYEEPVTLKLVWQLTPIKHIRRETVRSIISTSVISKKN